MTNDEVVERILSDDHTIYFDYPDIAVVLSYLQSRFGMSATVKWSLFDTAHRVMAQKDPPQLDDNPRSFVFIHQNRHWYTEPNP